MSFGFCKVGGYSPCLPLLMVQAPRYGVPRKERDTWFVSHSMRGTPYLGACTILLDAPLSRPSPKKAGHPKAAGRDVR